MLAGKDDLHDRQVQVQLLRQERDGTLRLYIRCDESARVQYAVGLRRKRQCHGDCDHPETHDQPAIAGG